MKCPRAFTAPSPALNDLAGSGRPTVLEKEDALVLTQQHLAIAHRNAKMGLRERALDMGRHVVGALGYMTVKDGVLRRLRIGKIFQIAHYIRIYVFLNEKRRGCVAQIERQQTRRNALSVEPGHDFAGDLIQPLSGRSYVEAVLGECPGRQRCRHRIVSLHSSSGACPAPPARPSNTASQIPSIVKAAFPQKIRDHGAPHPVMADNDERVLAGQRLKLLRELLHGNRDTVAEGADRGLNWLADIEHGMGNPVATHAGQGVNVYVVNSALHVIDKDYSPCPSATDSTTVQYLPQVNGLGPHTNGPCPAVNDDGPHFCFG